MLERFDTSNLASIVADLKGLQAHYESFRPNLGAGTRLRENEKQVLLAVMHRAADVCGKVGLDKSAERARSSVRQLETFAAYDYSTACSELGGLTPCVLTELMSHYFLHISQDRQEFLPTKMVPMARVSTAHFFGIKVPLAFPTMRRDLNEASYCLAVEANTAAVYHLICAAEHGLRFLARDRRVKFHKGPLELHQWGEIIRELETKISVINNWKKSLAREAALEFYNKALKDCRYFNEAYRRHMAHARRFYDRFEALSVAHQARDFLELLASRISENKRTPLIWKKA